MRENPFNSNYTDQTDSELVEASLNGSRQSLEFLIIRHRPFVYNIAWKMILNPQNAEDITQDILIKIMVTIYHFTLKVKFKRSSLH